MEARMNRKLVFDLRRNEVEELVFNDEELDDKQAARMEVASKLAAMNNILMELDDSDVEDFQELILPAADDNDSEYFVGECNPFPVPMTSKIEAHLMEGASVPASPKLVGLQKAYCASNENHSAENVAVTPTEPQSGNSSAASTSAPIGRSDSCATSDENRIISVLDKVNDLMKVMHLHVLEADARSCFFVSSLDYDRFIGYDDKPLGNLTQSV